MSRESRALLLDRLRDRFLAEEAFSDLPHTTALTDDPRAYWIPVSREEFDELALSETTPVWIPMKERQPSDFQAVLCRNSAGYMATANRFSFGEGRWDGAYYTAEDAAPVIGEITHWMPLPMPPSERDGE